MPHLRRTNALPRQGVRQVQGGTAMRYDNRLREGKARPAAWRTVACIICMGIAVYVMLHYGPVLALIPILWGLAAVSRDD